MDIPKLFIQKKLSWNKFIKKTDVYFLLVLFSGIFTAIMVGSKLILFLIDNYSMNTISFFIGLIIASAIFLTKHLEKRSVKNTITLSIGIVVGISFLFFSPVLVTPSLLYLFISGFLAVSALFLPGISGSFILLVLGVYEYVLSLVHAMFQKPDEIMVFFFGAIIGAVTISKVVHYLFKINKPRTIHGLLGLVIGSLSVPIKKLILEGTTPSPLTGGFFLLGIFVVYFIEKLAK